MENAICIFLLVLVIVLFKIIFKIDFKKIKSINQNKELEKITDKFPENVEIAKEMLDMLGNNVVRIEEAKDTKTSLYIAITNKISIADMKNNYARIQTIAHECIHSAQDRTILLFNFIFSNINLIYFIAISILTIFKVVNNQILQIAILILTTFVQFAVRSYLEIDAMTRAKFLAKEYLEKKKLTTQEEQEKILGQYEEINKIGIPFTIWNLIINCFSRVILYCGICLII